MINNSIFLILCTALFLFTACSDDPSSSSQSYNGYVPTYTSEDYNGIRNELRNATLFCDNDTDCPDNIGMIYINTTGTTSSPIKVGHCTGFLVAQDVVATNSHCIPDYIKKNREYCSDNIAIRFNKNYSDSPIYGCTELLDYSDIKLSHQDYAFFRIEPTNLTPFLISKNGMIDGENLNVYSVTPMKTVRGGVIEKKSCELALGTIINLQGASRWSPSGLALNCKAVSGNSGSPVLNDEGAVIGILESMATAKYIVLVETIFQSFGLKMPSQLPPHFNFTNFACVKDPVTETAQSKKCNRVKDLNSIHCTDFDVEQTTANFEKIVEKWSNSYQFPGIFSYNIIYQYGSMKVEAEPYCVKSQENYTGYDRYVSPEGIIGFRKEFIRNRFPRSLSYKTVFSLDENLKFDPVLGLKKVSEEFVSLEIQKENDKWVGKQFENTQLLGIPIRRDKGLLDLVICEANAKNKVLFKMADGRILTDAQILAEAKEKADSTSESESKLNKCDID